MTEQSEKKTYFSDPRLNMTVVGRLAVRLCGYIFYLVLIAATFTFLGSDVSWLKWFGVLLCFFLADRVFHRGEADRPLSEFPDGKRVNLSHYLMPRAFAIVERAYDRCMFGGGNFHLEFLRELLDQKAGTEILRRLDVPLSEFKQRMDELIKDHSLMTERGSARDVQDAIEALLLQALCSARGARHRFITIHDLFSGLRRVGYPLTDRLFDMFSIESGDLERAAIFSAVIEDMGGFRGRPSSFAGIIPGSLRHVRHRVMNRAWTSRPTPALDRVSSDLTDLARLGEIGFMVGHDAEYKRILRTLARPMNPNVLLIGEATIGKSTIVSHLAFALTKDNVPKELFDKRLVSLRVSEVVAGVASENALARINEIVDEIITAGNIILYIPDMHELLGNKSGAAVSLADALMPAIMHSAFPVIGATFPREYHTHIEPRSDILGVFEKINVAEISEDEAEDVLMHEALMLELQYRIMIGVSVLKRTVKIAKRYITDKFLPGSAIELLREAITIASEAGEKCVLPEHIVRVAEAKTNVPIHEAAGGETDLLLHLEDVIHETFIDQEDAVKALARALREYRSGLSRKGGPIGGFLFVGPTGVGKTELAKTLARLEFGSEDALIRFDMTEYQDKASFARFIGSPDGAVRGALTEAIHEKPYSVVLLDEFEKAYPDILNLFLQVLDDGRLTDASGRVVDFQNAIVIATSNAHSGFILESMRRGDKPAHIEEQLKKRLAEVFRPELLNRFSRIIMFKNLAPQDVRRIAELQLHSLGKQLSLQGITLTVTPEAIELVGKIGYDPEFGARPLRRVIEESIRATLAEKILKKEVRRGSALTLDADGGEIVLH